MHPMETKTALGATNTEDGKANQSNLSVSEVEAKVKQTQAMELVFPTPEPKAVPSLDLRTEMFMLNEVQRTMNSLYVDNETRCKILSDLISKCAMEDGV